MALSGEPRSSRTAPQLERRDDRRDGRAEISVTYSCGSNTQKRDRYWGRQGVRRRGLPAACRRCEMWLACVWQRMLRPSAGRPIAAAAYTCSPGCCAAAAAAAQSADGTVDIQSAAHRGSTSPAAESRSQPRILESIRPQGDGARFFRPSFPWRRFERSAQRFGVTDAEPAARRCAVPECFSWIFAVINAEVYETAALLTHRKAMRNPTRRVGTLRTVRPLPRSEAQVW